MKYLSIPIVFLLLLIVITDSIGAPSIITYHKSTEKIKIGNKVSIQLDINHTFTIDQIVSDTTGKNIYTESMPNLGLSNYIYWAKFDFVNTTAEHLILSFNQPLLSEITFYKIDGKKLTEITYSESNPFFSRKYYYPSYAFDMDAGINDTISYILKFQSNKPIIFDVDIANESVVAKEELQQELITGIFTGIIFVMFFYNLFIYLTALDTSYLAYVCYIFFIGLTHITLPGYGFKYIWPNTPDFNDLSVTLFCILASVFGIEFLKQFLRTKQHVPLLHTLFSLFEIIFVSILIIHFTGNKILAFTIIQFLTIALSLSMIFTAIKVIHMGYRPAIFFLTAWLTLLLSVCIFIGKDFSLIPYNFFTAHSMQIGSALEVTLLSLALADRINILKKEKEASQALALHTLQQNEMIITNQNIILEKKVSERTKEIEDTNKALYKALAELEKADTRLANRGKIISLNTLSADIDQQSNSSDNSGSSNILSLKREPGDIFDLLTKYEMNTPSDSPENKTIKLNMSLKKVDYSAIKEEIEQLLSGIEDGATRTAALVKGLRVFSPLNENDLKRMSVTENIHSILIDLNAEVSGTIDVIKKFTPIPEIECFPAKLNEVFINILNNAIYAIKEKKDREDKGLLIITSYSDTKKIYISVKDNGIGMTEEVKTKMFEPFFTTKTIGDGFGLGLSISLSIISDHNGSIEFNTAYGKGTECIITLPINYTK